MKTELVYRPCGYHDPGAEEVISDLVAGGCVEVDSVVHDEECYVTIVRSAGFADADITKISNVLSMKLCILVSSK